MPLGDIFVDPYGYPWPADQMPIGIPRSDLKELAYWPSVQKQDKEYDWRLRFAYRGETSSTPEHLRGLVIPRMDEPRGTLERPNTSVFFQPTTKVLGIGEYLTLDGLGSWLSKKIFGSRGDNAKAFFSERNAVKVGLVIGGPVGAAIANDAKNRAERSREENQEFRENAAAQVDPAKVAAGLSVQQPQSAETIASEAILAAIRRGALKEGMGTQAYLADKNFSARAVQEALKTLKKGRKDLKLQLEDNRKEQEILANEIAQVLSGGRVKPVKDAMPLEEIHRIEAKATVEVMKAEQIPTVPENVNKVIPEIQNEWMRQAQAALLAAKAEERLVKRTITNVDQAERATKGVTVGAKMGREWARGGRW